MRMRVKQKGPLPGLLKWAKACPRKRGLLYADRCGPGHWKQFDGANGPLGITGTQESESLLTKSTNEYRKMKQKQER